MIDPLTLQQQREKKNRDIAMKLVREIKIATAESAMGAIDSRYGVDLVSREVTSIAERPLYTGDHTMSDSTIKETPWDLARLVERPTLVSTFDWVSTSTGVIDTRAIPASILPVQLVKMPFNSFQFWRGDVILRLQVAGSPMVQGIIGMSFVPLALLDDIKSMSWDYSSLSLNPTVYLYANTNTMAELRIPFNHPQSYLYTDFEDSTEQEFDRNLGYLLIYVLEPLITIGSISKVTLSLFSVLENSEFKVPRLSSEITTQMAKSESALLSSAIHSLGDIGSTIVSPFIDSTVDSAKNTIERLSGTGKNELVDRAAAKSMPENFIGDAIDFVGGAIGSVLGIFGLDNPTIPVEGERNIIRVNGSMNYATGPEHIEKMAIMPSALPLVTPETFATVADEMDMRYLYRKYSYLGAFQVTKSNTPGTLVYTMPLSPMPTLTTELKAGKLVGPVTMNGIIQDAVWFPLISYLGLPFKYWTGGLRYKFIVSASSLHTCKLFVSFNYGRYGVKPTTLTDAASQYGVALEISQGSNEFEFAVPYVATTPYKFVSSGDVTESNAMGSLNVYVMNQLIAPDTVADKISIVMFIAGAEDFSYEWLGGQNAAAPIFRAATNRYQRKVRQQQVTNLAENPINDVSDNFIYKDAIAESGVVGVQSTAPLNVDATVTDVAENEEDVGQEQIAPPQVQLTVDDHFGITTISLRDMLKRYQPVYRKYIASEQEDSRVQHYVDIERFFELPGTVVGSGFRYTTGTASGLMSWAAGMFRQFKGGLRFKAVVSAQGKDNVSSRNVSFASVQYRPGPLDEIGQYDDINFNQDMALSVSQEINVPVTLATTQFGPSSTISKLNILNGSICNVIEFEVPYTSLFNSALLLSGAFDDGPYSGLGSLYFTLQSSGSDTVYTLDIYMAFADESRFGTLYRVPLVYVPASNTFPPPSKTANLAFNRYAETLSTTVALAESGAWNWGVTKTATQQRKARNRFIRKGNINDYIGRQLRKFLMSNAASFMDVQNFLQSLSRSLAFNVAAQKFMSSKRLLNKYGIVCVGDRYWVKQKSLLVTRGKRIQVQKRPMQIKQQSEPSISSWSSTWDHSNWDIDSMNHANPSLDDKIKLD